MAGQGVDLDTATAIGWPAFGSFAALAEFKRGRIAERPRARSCKGGQPFKMAAAKLHSPRAAMGWPGTKVGKFCAEPGVSRRTPCRRMGPQVALNPDEMRLLDGRLRLWYFKAASQTQTPVRSSP